MKQIVFLILMVFAFSCEKDKSFDSKPLDASNALQKARSYCGQPSVQWFDDLLQKAEADKKDKTHKGNYIGYVSVIKVNNVPLFYTNFMLGSGGVIFHLFDCSGKAVYLSSEAPTKILDAGSNKSNFIYTNIEGL